MSFGQHQGRVSFDQKFRHFRFKIKWNRKFPEDRFENFGPPLEVVLFSGNLEIPEFSCSIKKITQTAVINIVFQRIFKELDVSYASPHTFSKVTVTIFEN